MKYMSKRIPRITTRGMYDLHDGSEIPNHVEDYRIYPKYCSKNLDIAKELVVIVHGMRNTNFGALEKVPITKLKLKQLRYRKDIIAYSYDANVANAHIKSKEKHAVDVAEIIAKKNGKHLAKFVKDLNVKNPKVKIRLIGHSLGSEVILSALEQLSENSIYGVIMLGASIRADFQKTVKYRKIITNVIEKDFVNYYCPSDEVLADADKLGYPEMIGLVGAKGKTAPNYKEHKRYVANHSYYCYISVINEI